MLTGTCLLSLRSLPLGCLPRETQLHLQQRLPAHKPQQQQPPSYNPVLLAPDFGSPFHLVVDASDVGAGAVLLQHGPDGIEHPVCYFSRKCNVHKRAYSPTIERGTKPRPRCTTIQGLPRLVVSPDLGRAAFFKESSPIRIAFNLPYLLNYFGMVTTEQKEGKCVEHVLSDSQLIKNPNPRV